MRLLGKPEPEFPIAREVSECGQGKVANPCKTGNCVRVATHLCTCVRIVGIICI